MFATFINDFLALGALKIIGLVGTVILGIIFITWLVAKVFSATQSKHKIKLLREERNRQIAFEHEVHDFVAEEVRKQLVDNGLIKDMKGKYNFGAEGLRVE